MMTIVSHCKPTDSVSQSPLYRLFVNDEEVHVYACDVGHYALMSGQGKLRVRVQTVRKFSHVKVRPLRHSIWPQVNEASVEFEIEAPAKISIEMDDDIRNPLFLIINPPESSPVHPDSVAHYFAPGMVHEAGEIELQSGDSVYIAEGAVVYGWFKAMSGEDISIRGRGVLTAHPVDGGGTKQNMIRLVDCANVVIEGITIVDGPTWHVVPIGCRQVQIQNVSIVGVVGTGDGFDVVGCQNVWIDQCFARVKDDCVAIKATDYQHPLGCQNVHGIRVTGCVFWNAEWGNAIEIGYETRCDEISDIVFEDCDIIRCEVEGYQSGGTFTIHNGDRAVVRNVRYENIRIEDSREKLVDIKVLYAQYTVDAERGQVRDIVFKDIQVVDGPFPVSIIRGFEGERHHMIANVSFENLVVHGKKIMSATDAKMVVELSTNITWS